MNSATTTRRAARRSRPARRRATGPALRLAAPGGQETAEAYRRVLEAILDHSLPPGTRLVEGELCEIFKLGRTRMRQVLQRLAHERMVTLMRNRGATVARPSVSEARDVFAARRVLECGIVQAFLTQASEDDLQRLHTHLAEEQRAWRELDHRAILKLSGEFHLLIAEAAGNQILTGMLRDLVAHSSLIIAVYRSPRSHPCPPDAHRQLTELLARRDPRAADAMLQHLDHVMADLRFEEQQDVAVDLHKVFTPDRDGVS